MQGLYTPQIHYRHRCHSLQQVEVHKDADLDTGCIVMTDLFSDFTYNRHRHRPSGGNQHFLLHIGFRDNMVTDLDYLQTTFSQVQVSKYTQLKADNYVRS